MDVKDLALEIESEVRRGNLAEVRRLVDDIRDINVIRQIEEEFPDRDPVVCAIHYKEEQIALYLVEKGFNHRRFYNYPGMKCDEWCYYNHHDDPCPAEYDALDLAAQKKLHKIHSVIMNIRDGLRMPGDGLALMQGPDYKREDSSMSNRVRAVSASSDTHNTNTKGGQARKKIKELGLQYRNRNGDSVIHMCDSAEMVHACANMGVPINAQNFDGDSALHLAIRERNRDVCQALLMNGADPKLKNKFGLTPWDKSNGSTIDILKKFTPGLPEVVLRGEYNSMQRLIRLWCNPHSKITRDGMSAMQTLERLRPRSEANTRTYSIMAAHCKTLEVTHAVLSEDIPTLKNLLRKEKGWALNKRFKGSMGDKTLVSCAIDQHNLEVLELLVETKKSNFNMRVRDMEDEDSEDTMPILFKTLDEDCPEEIWSLVDREVDVFQTREKNYPGDTAILRALWNGRSARFIHRFIKRHPTCLTERNLERLNARELAQALKRLDIVEVIDSFIISRASFSFLAQFPVAFYGLENLPSHEEVQKLLPSDKYNRLESQGMKLHEAAACGNLKDVSEHNNADYRDKNGFTALIRAIVGMHYDVAELLITERPTLKSIPDNGNRYPLHYAYALPDEKGEDFVKLLLARNPADIEFKVDKDGREPIEYQDLRDTEKAQDMLRDVLTLNTKGERIVHGGLTNTPVSNHAEDIHISGE